MATSLGTPIPIGQNVGLVSALSLAVGTDYLVTNNGAGFVRIAEGPRAPDNDSHAWTPFGIRESVGITPDANGDEHWVQVVGSHAPGSVSVNLA